MDPLMRETMALYSILNRVGEALTRADYTKAVSRDRQLLANSV